MLTDEIGNEKSLNGVEGVIKKYPMDSPMWRWKEHLELYLFEIDKRERSAFDGTKMGSCLCIFYLTVKLKR